MPQHPSAWKLAASVGLAVACASMARFAPLARAQQASASRAAAAPVAQPGAQTIPLRVITLYRSGVGYFERQGSVTGDAHVSIRFDREHINDILKSMVVLDMGGGGVSAIGYGSKEPLQRRLESFGVNIANNPSMADLMGALRGARIRLTTPDGPVEGTILGTEARMVAQPEPRPTSDGASRGFGAPVAEWFINVVTASGIKSVPVSRVNAYEILDQKLAEELSLALQALAEARDEQSASVDLAFTGADQRAVVLGYVHETPVWKTSYRIVLPDASESGAGKPQVQGWAIVENTTDEDWADVRLSLASGNPVGFRMDLHEPLFVARPMLPVPTAIAARARMYESVDMPIARGGGIMNDALEESRVAPASAAPAREAMSLQRRNWDASGEVMNKTADDMLRYSAASQASAGEVGEAFRYEISAPVTIQRQRSAMLPIINAPTDGRRVSIFNANDNRMHPMRGVELTNTTGFELAPGPISVFDGAGYSGDAQIGFTSRGQKRLLSYAVDLDVRVAPEQHEAEEITGVKIVDGAIEQRSVSRITSKYTLTNRDGKRDRVVLIEQIKRPAFDLKAPSEPDSEGEGLNRFEVSLGKAEQKEFSVVEERTNHTRVAVLNYDLPTLISFAQNGKASQKVVDAVRKAAELQAAVNDAKSRVADLERERDEISKDQARVRANMGAVGHGSDLYTKYMQTLTEQETRIEAIYASLRELASQQAQAERALKDYLTNLNVQ